MDDAVLVESKTRCAMIDWRNVSLLGIDVGFSAKTKSTGIAIYHHGRLVTLTCVGSSSQQRAEAIPADLTFDAIAIDGPIVAETNPPLARVCERILSRGKFSQRCKPGLSHFGFGLPLRDAATRIANEMRAAATPAPVIAEAFPNAFLGVLLDDKDYEALGPIKRGHKSDVYYARAAATGRFETIFEHLRWTDGDLLAAMHDNAASSTRAAHDKRAALICLLTAACALSSAAEYIGDEAGGFICLPPRELWAAWARDALLP